MTQELKLSPGLLDWIANGVPVRIYKRPDDTVYASVEDFSRFGVEPVETIRVSCTPTLPADIQTWPEVIAALARHAK